MNRTFFSVFMRCTCAALNARGACTVPDNAAIPCSPSPSAAPTGESVAGPQTQANPTVKRTVTRRSEDRFRMTDSFGSGIALLERTITSSSASGSEAEVDLAPRHPAPGDDFEIRAGPEPLADTRHDPALPTAEVRHRLPEATALGDEQVDLGAGLSSPEEELRAGDSLPRLRHHFFDDQALEGVTAVVPALERLGSSMALGLSSRSTRSGWPAGSPRASCSTSTTRTSRAAPGSRTQTWSRACGDPLHCKVPEGRFMYPTPAVSGRGEQGEPRAAALLSWTVGHLA